MEGTDLSLKGIGLDFGTGTSALALVRRHNDRPYFVKPYVSRDQHWLESAVAWDDPRRGIVVGRKAQEACVIKRWKNEPVCYPIKLHMGSKEKFPLGQLGMISPQEHAAYVLARLVARGASQHTVPIQAILDAPTVITYPADANEAHRQATLDAARLVGFRKVFGIAEPHAAAYTYVLHNREVITLAEKAKRDDLLARRQAEKADTDQWTKGVLTRNINAEAARLRAAIESLYTKLERKPFLVYDFGAGTFDAVVGEMKRNEAGVLLFKILGRDGKKGLGGFHISLDFARAMVEDLKKTDPSAPRGDDRLTQYALWEIAEAAKIRLSEDGIVRVTVRIATDGEPYLREQIWRREQFHERIFKPRLQETLEVCRAAIREATRNAPESISGPEDIEFIFLVGGSSKIPGVRQALKGILGKRAEFTDVRKLVLNIQEDIGLADIRNRRDLSGREVPDEFGDPMLAVVGGAAIAAQKWQEAEENGTADARTFLEALGVQSRSNYSLWWNGEEEATSFEGFEPICDRGQSLPYSYVERNIYPKFPERPALAWSLWQSSEAVDVVVKDRKLGLLSKIGHIRLKQVPSKIAHQIEFGLQVLDDGELSISASQEKGDNFLDRAKLTSVFVPEGGLSSSERAAARERVGAYLEDSLDARDAAEL